MEGERSKPDPRRRPGTDSSTWVDEEITPMLPICEHGFVAMPLCENRLTSSFRIIRLDIVL